MTAMMIPVDTNQRRDLPADGTHKIGIYPQWEYNNNN